MPEQKITIVGFGDSITQAVEVDTDKQWLNILRKNLSDRYPQYQWTTINAGVGGNTSREGLARMEADVFLHRPDLVLIEFGGNDATDEENRHVSLEEFQNNLSLMLERLKSVSARAVMIVFPPIIDAWHIWKDKSCFASHGGPDRYVEQYRRITRNFAASKQLPLADIDAALRENSQRYVTETFIRSCGVHLTEAGNQVVAQTLFQTLTADNVF